MPKMGRSAGHPAEDGQRPSVAGYVTLRDERFGALAYNPVLDVELPLDPSEAFVARLCDGTRTLAQVAEAAESQCGLPAGNGLRLATTALGRLAGILAVEYRGRDVNILAMTPGCSISVEDGHPLSAPRLVTWEVTYACHMRCPHCFTAAGKPVAGELDTAQAFTLIAALARAKVFKVLLSGGEPLLRPDIARLVKALATSGMRVEVGTSGAFLPGHARDLLAGPYISRVHVSIDGLGPEHDRFRGRKGTFDAACGTIRFLRGRGKKVTMSTAVTSRNLRDLGRIIDLAGELGCDFKAIPFFPVGRGRDNDTELRLGPLEYREMNDAIIAKGEALRGKINVTTETCFPFTSGPQPANAADRGPMYCSAGHDTLCIGADGTAYPCPYLREFPIGSLKEAAGLAGVWDEPDALRAFRGLDKRDMGEPCRSCGYAPAMCQGGCRALAYLEHGSVTAADPSCGRSPDDTLRR